ncbi:hypothetical protein [Catenulispora pinisilvae]|uniref:hypothetical protein n=1 Tax=Catenulispora pinisilvae TaxID=2705253 RepID=UPI00189269E2|nr:hypothetical protein [Catenulispora pinisilvae]
MDAVSRLSAALWNGVWPPQPHDPGYARELLRASGWRHRNRQAVNRANGVLVPTADSDEPRLLQQALDVEAAGTGLRREISRYHQAVNNVGIRQDNQALPSRLDGGPLAFLMDAILAIGAVAGPLEPHRAWRAYGGPTPSRRQADVFEHDHLHPHRDSITTAATYLTGIQTLLDQVTKAPPGPWLDMAERERLLARLGLPHRGWRQDQREVWAEGFVIPGAPPPRRRHYDHLTAHGADLQDGGPGASLDVDGEQIATRLTADLVAGAWVPTPWEQDRASQLRTLIEESQNTPTPAIRLMSDRTPDEDDWLMRAAALWCVSQECENLTSWWTDSQQQALPLLEAVYAIRAAIPRRVNLAVVEAQLGQKTGLWKSNVDKDFPPALRTTMESAERTLAAMSAMLARVGTQGPQDRPN